MVSYSCKEILWFVIHCEVLADSIQLISLPDNHQLISLNTHCSTVQWWLEYKRRHATYTGQNTASKRWWNHEANESAVGSEEASTDCW